MLMCKLFGHKFNHVMEVNYTKNVCGMYFSCSRCGEKQYDEFTTINIRKAKER